MNDFDAIAPYYDRLARIVFGDAIRRSQFALVDHVPAGSRVLFLGGGTGAGAWNILQNTENVRITYLEKSLEMISRARKMVPDALCSQVTFVHLPFEDYGGGEKFDVVVAQYFFDIFSEPQLAQIIKTTKSQLSRNGILLVSDFQKVKTPKAQLWQGPILWLMHRFFGLVCQLQSRKLNDISQMILAAGFQEETEELFFGDLIFSRVFRNSTKWCTVLGS